MSSSFLPSIPYPPSREGYWSPVTATLNWCEEDYYASEYAAEIVNTITNTTFVYLAYKGIRNCIKNGHDTVFLAGFLSFLFIGIGSICFHLSLKYPMQLLDELSMIYFTCTMFFAVFSFRRAKPVVAVVFVFTVVLAAFITGYYHYLKDPLFHQNMFAIICTVTILTSIYNMERNLRPSWRKASQNNHLQQAQPNGDSSPTKSSPAEQKRIDERDTKILMEMWAMVGCGLGTVALGFFLWNMDNVFCGKLRQWRRSIGLPWGILLEGHGWWHIFTGLSAYYNITWGIWLRYCLKNMQDEVEVVWPSLFTSVPVVVRKSPGKSRTD